eukprot:Hpha_TRINITY_DN9015_c0_g1::TRINITY_DN9015_c0_g1_i1::g.141861::m.141861
MAQKSGLWSSQMLSPPCAPLLGWNCLPDCPCAGFVSSWGSYTIPPVHAPVVASEPETPASSVVTVNKPVLPPCQTSKSVADGEQSGEPLLVRLADGVLLKIAEYFMDTSADADTLIAAGPKLWRLGALQRIFSERALAGAVRLQKKLVHPCSGKPLCVPRRWYVDAWECDETSCCPELSEVSP